MIFPMTYVFLAVWLCFMLVFEKNFARLMSITFGILLALFTFGGETWLVSDNTTQALSTVTFDDGFAYIIGIILIGFNLMYAYMIIAQKFDKKMKWKDWATL